MSTTTTAAVPKSKQEGRYDRQERAIGVEAMKKLFATRLLIVGMGGLGVEIAKNVVLMGIRYVGLYDNNNVSSLDLSSQFFVGEDSVGKNRVDECISKLRTLNDACTIEKVTGDLTEELLSQFTIVVFTDTSVPKLVEINRICRSKDIKFCAAETRGVFGWTFVDFGDEFVVKDVDGAQPLSGVIVDITVDNNGDGIVNVLDPEVETKTPHRLSEGDTVTFANVEGMVELNDGEPRPVKVVDRYRFNIGNVSKYGKYTGGGYFNQVKSQKKLSFKSLAECLENPQCEFLYDFAKMEAPLQIHLGMRALSKFVEKQGRYPKPYNEEDAKELVTIATELDAGKGALDANLIKLLSYTALGQLNPMVATFGGLVSQEIMKASTQKYHPIHQWFFFESTLSLPSTLPTEEEAKPTGSRYDGQIAVFGETIQSKIENQKVFVVGAGALGCEFLKNFAMMGIGCGPRGKITVTDMDSIETSNLSRQFLFRDEHVGMMKSAVAGNAAKVMNPHFNVKAMQDKVAPDTEEVFDDQFFTSLDAVVTALDNVAARRYIDQRCVYFKKPMIDSGTLGSQAHVELVIPHLTESYSSKVDPEPESIPQCTLHRFPNMIEHTITWARELFTNIFKSNIALANNFLKDPEGFLKGNAQNIGALETVYEAVIKERPKSYDDCIAWARVQFEQKLNHLIKDVLHTYPPEMKTESGASFWSGSKRCPTINEFNHEDQSHLDFIEATARLIAFVYGITVDPNANYAKVAAGAPVPSYVARTLPKDEKEKQKEQASEPTEEERKLLAQKEQEEAEMTMKYISKLTESLKNSEDYKELTHLAEIDFEKDDDTNYHMDFITAASNLRARSYKIPEADKHKTKGIAGNIIPAMITTTALVTGLVALELYKVIQGFKKLEQYRCAFLNIAVPFLTMSEPTEAKAIYLNKYTLWDSLDVLEAKDITLKQLLDKLQAMTDVEITGLNCGSLVLMTFFMQKERLEQRLTAPVAALIQHLSGQKFGKKVTTIGLTATGITKSGDVTSLPLVKYQFRAQQSAAGLLAAKKAAAAKKATPKQE